MQCRPAGAVHGLVLLAVTAAVVLLGAGRADAAQLHCGDTIEKDTTLHADLSGCEEIGIEVGADGVTLNLNGHSITGDGDGPEECCDIGVAIDRHARVVVKGGSTRRFDIGVAAFRARKVRVQDVSSSRNAYFGAVLSQATHSVVRKSSMSHNVAPEGDGLGIFYCDHIRISGNSIRDNPGPGIHLDHSNDSLVKDNLMSNDGPAVSVEKANRNEVRGNRMIRGAGILVVGNRNVVAANRISKSEDALAVERGRHNLLAGNVVVDARSNGIRLGVGAPSIGGARNVVRRNVVKRSRRDGFHVYPKDGNSLLKRNTAIASGDDGFDIRKDSTALIRNRALRNDDLGFRATRRPAVAQGNVARGNGDPRQCRHVRCR